MFAAFGSLAPLFCVVASVGSAGRVGALGMTGVVTTGIGGMVGGVGNGGCVLDDKVFTRAACLGSKDLDVSAAP